MKRARANVTLADLFEGPDPEDRRPFTLRGPACVSFSGGLTSGYMLRRVLDAHGGELPPDVHVIFANTGLEHPGTLDFVQACSDQWRVPITWVEYDDETQRHKVVSHASASRNGEPFRALVRRKRAVPNQRARWCTQRLKVESAREAMRDLGHESWTDLVGLRADEPLRVARKHEANAKGDEEVTFATPLDSAGIVKTDVQEHWARQSFGLRIPSGCGNCQACFWKPAQELVRIIARDETVADPYIDMERETGHRFLFDGPEVTFVALREQARRLRDKLKGEVPEAETSAGVDCACTD